MERRKGEFSKREEKKESPNFMDLQKEREKTCAVVAIFKQGVACY